MKQLLLIIVISTLILSISGCINTNEDEEYYEKCEYEFNVMIDSKSSDSYELLVPLPVYSDNERKILISTINDELKVIQGNAHMNIENTSFGPGIKINGTGNIQIGFLGNELKQFLINEKYVQLLLSMAKDKDNDGYYDDEYGDIGYNVYLGYNISMEIIITFQYSYEDGPGTHLSSQTSIQGSLYQGWNLINGTFLTEVE